MSQDFEEAVKRLECNADLNLQVQDDLWRVAKECRALHKILGELLVTAEEALNQWRREDLDSISGATESATLALDEAVDAGYQVAGRARPA